MRDVAEVRHQGAITTEIAREALDLLEVDERGLERTDRALLRAVVEKFEGGPVGLSTLAVALGEEPDTIEDVYEPYLLQLGFLQRTPRGRVVTKLGRQHVGAAARRRRAVLIPQLAVRVVGEAGEDGLPALAVALPRLCGRARRSPPSRGARGRRGSCRPRR